MSTRNDSTHEDAELSGRRRIMGICARAKGEELAAALAAIGHAGPVEDLRPAEIGLVMTRGRIGGDGAPFNLGEASVARAAVRLASGETGFAYHLGRDLEKARTAAILDALWQHRQQRASVEQALAAAEARLAEERALAARHTAATRVEFFTMVRGED